MRYSLTPLSFWFDRCSRAPGGWFDEVCRRSKALVERANAPVLLFMSGGIDSEVIAESMVAQKLPFKCVSVDYRGLNEHDISHAIDWCKERKVEHKILKLSIEDVMLELPSKLSAQGYRSWNMFRYIQIRLMELAEDLKGFGVLGAGEFNFTPELELEFEPGHTVPYEWLSRNGLAHEPYFFYSSPELAAAWLELPLIKFSLENPAVLEHPVNRVGLKQMAVRTIFPQQRWRTKFNGFENLRGVRGYVERLLEERFGPKPLFKLRAAELKQQLAATG